VQVNDALSADINVVGILGGLAPDSDQPMPSDMQHMLQQTWRRIEQSIPGTQFNHSFWTDNSPRRSTYPACRAVLAATEQHQDFEAPMVLAIQHAYYMHARNPSDDAVLIDLASEIGCDAERFTARLNSDANHNALAQQIQFAGALGVRGFPSLVLELSNSTRYPIQIDHNNAATIVDRIEQKLAA